MANPIVWMNGNYVDYASATIPIEDRGFQFGDSVYEVIRAIRGEYFRFGEHLSRLRRSLESVQITIALTDEDLKRIAQEMVAKEGSDDLTLYIQVTRGVAGRAHLYPLDVRPTVIMIARNFHPMPEESYSRGIGVILLKDDRWLRCDIKSTCLLANVLARDLARKANVKEAILVRDGIMTEGTATNLFVVRNGEVATPLADHRILKGVTRDCVLELSRKLGFPTSERNVSAIEIKEADEVFLTGTTMDILPVLKIDHFPVGSGSVGPITKALIKEYRSILFNSRR